MSTDTERLDEANACHDAEPARAAELLRQLDTSQLPAERRPNYAFLINHVLGEKLSAWDEALARQQQLIALALPAPQTVLWRQLGAAALVVGASEPLTRAATELVAASSASIDRAHELVALSAAMYLVPAQTSGDAAQTALRALAAVTDSAWPTRTLLDAQAAACVNNIANGLLERPDAALQHGALRAALARSAEQAQRLWQHAGTWVQHDARSTPAPLPARRSANRISPGTMHSPVWHCSMRTTASTAKTWTVRSSSWNTGAPVSGSAWQTRQRALWLAPKRWPRNSAMRV